MSHQMNHPPVVELENGELCVRYPAEYYQTSEK